MSEPNIGNERIKRRYFHYLREAEGRSPKTVEHARHALVRYERFTECKDFKRFKSADAIRFRKSLLDHDGKRAVQLSSRATIHTVLTQLRKFFRWLAGQPGFKKSIGYAEADYFSLSARDRKIALERRERPCPTLEQIGKVIGVMPGETDVELRNRALVACAALTGARVSALATLKLKHVRPDRQGINQDAAEVETKFAKTFPTFFFPVGEDIRDLFLDYVDHLQSKRLFGGDDPLFPSSKQDVGAAHMFETTGLRRGHWMTADPVRRIFKEAFARAGLPYYSPHSFRRTLARLGEQVCSTPEAFKAWSQNLGHEEVLTTFTSYGAVAPIRQAELMSALNPRQAVAEYDLAAALRNALPPEVLRALQGAQ
jgi:integrase